MAKSVLYNTDEYNCTICLELMKDPVTIPCGHSYCLVCIRDYWDMNDLNRITCPQCRQNFRQRPALNRNTMLNEILDKLRNITTETSYPDVSPAEPGDIVCDSCIGSPIAAVKSCLDCRASFCKTHLEAHYNSPALKKHKLVKPTSMPTCQKHDKLLEVFCRTDQHCICTLCLIDDHKGHDVVSPAEERAEKQISLEAGKSKLERERTERQKLLHELQKLTDFHSLSAQQVVEETDLAFTSLISFLEKQRSEVTEMIRTQAEIELGDVTNLQENLELEVAMKMAKEDVMDKLLQTGDDIYFLQNYESMPTPSGVQHLGDLAPICSYGDVSQSVSEFKDKLELFCKQEVDKILVKVSNSTAQVSLVQIKKGDRVRVKSSVKKPKFNWGPCVTHKSVGIVMSVDDDTLTVKFPGQKTWTGVVYEMELVADDESGIKVGDKVRVKPSVVTPAQNWGGVTHRSVGVVTALNGEEMVVDFPEHSNWKGVVSEMEVVPAEWFSEINIGDKVRVKPSVLTPKKNWGSVTHRSVGVVTAINGEELVVDFPEHSNWKGVVSEMEVVSAEGFSGIKVGDKVRVKPSVVSPAQNWGSVTHRSVGVVTALNGEDVVVDFPEHLNWKGLVSEMEAVPAKGFSEPGSFQPGVRVRVKASVETPQHGWGIISHRSVGIIKSINDTTVTVDFPEHSNWSGILSEMELVS